MTNTAYVLASQESELERLRLQSQVWEPAGKRLLDVLGDGRDLRVLDVGCGGDVLARPAQRLGRTLRTRRGHRHRRWTAVGRRCIRQRAAAEQRRAHQGRHLRHRPRTGLVRCRPRTVPAGAGPGSPTRWPPTSGSPAPAALVVVEDVNPNSWQFVPPGTEVIRLVKQVFANLGLSEPSTVQLDMFGHAGITLRRAD